MSAPLIETKGLTKYFNVPKGVLHAVENIDLRLEAGQTLGVVGESGCGKSTLGRTILGLYEPTAGDVLYDGKSITGLKHQQKRKMYSHMQMVFQDPYASLDPRLSVSNIIEEPMKIFRQVPHAQLREATLALMDTVGLPARYANIYPHEMDGGRRQRVGLARALAVNPKFIVCDEPVSALDVSIQAQILNLLIDLQAQKGLAYLFITHNLCVVKHISNYIMVMYMGQMVEYAEKEELFRHPAHPYTQALLSAIPSPDLSRRNRERIVLEGEVSSPINPVAGCRFAARCRYATEKCTRADVKTQRIGPEHTVACTLFDKE